MATPPDLFREEDKRIRNFFRNHWNNNKSNKKGKGADHHHHHERVDEMEVMKASIVDVYENDNWNSIELCTVVPNAPAGFYVVKRALSPSQQYHWAKRAIMDFSQADHTNITNLQQQQQQQSSSPSSSSSNNASPASLQNSLVGLRWASLGYRYNWTLRKYQADNKSQIPLDFCELCQDIAQRGANLHIDPEAMIVNYYPLNGQMNGHLDDAEHCMEQPIVSLSLGCTAVFLIGGRTKETKPVALWLRSGDAVIMSGESRYCFHGVSVVVPPQEMNAIFGDSNNDNSNDNDDDDNGDDDNDDDKFVREYLRQNRININVRRVTRFDGVWEEKHGSGYSVI